MRRRGGAVREALVEVVTGFVLLSLLLLLLLLCILVCDGSLEENFALAQSHDSGRLLLL